MRTRQSTLAKAVDVFEHVEAIDIIVNYTKVIG